MSSKPALQTPEDLLEAPVAQEKTRGLVPRSSLFIVLLVFILGLFAFAAYDLTKSTSHSDSGSPTAAKTEVGNAPPSSDITETAKRQESKVEGGESVSGRMITPDEKWTARGNPPLNVNTQERSGTLPIVPSVVPGVATNSDGVVPISAADQRNAEASVSGIFALNGGTDSTESSSDGIAKSNIPGMSAALERVSELKRSIASSSNGPVINPAADIIKAYTASQQVATSAPPLGKDDAWLKQYGEGKKADATFADFPAADWIVFQGTRIPIVVREAVNSDLPGSITALSTAPIYDSIHQCAVMIPAGTKFLGAYSSNVRPGQVRVLMAYRRMIFPDGRSVDLGGAQSTDSIGQAGIEGDVNNHFLKLFGYGFAVALISDKTDGARVTTTQPNGSQTNTTLAGQVLGDIASRIMNRNADISPTITLPVGSRMYVTVTKDMGLTPISRRNCK